MARGQEYLCFTHVEVFIFYCGGGQTTHFLIFHAASVSSDNTEEESSFLMTHL